VLEGRNDIAAIHILSHGRSGTLDLGSTKLTAASMSGTHADAMQAIAHALSSDADILIYGCDFAAGVRGDTAVMLLSTLTGADVAASIDQTGAADKGGNWELEVATANIETETLTPFAWDGILDDPGGVVGGGHTWLIADEGFAGSVWTDQFGLHNLEQSNTNFQPTLVDGNNFHSAVRFDGINDWLGEADTNFPTTDYSVYAVLNTGDARYSKQPTEWAADISEWPASGKW